jgi:hypothetical protein
LSTAPPPPPPRPREKPGFSTWKGEIPRDTDSPLEEDGFELAVPSRRERLWAATPGKYCRFGPEPVSGSAFRAAVSDWQRPERAFCRSGTDGSNPVPSTGESLWMSGVIARSTAPAPFGPRRIDGPHRRSYSVSATSGLNSAMRRFGRSRRHRIRPKVPRKTTRLVGTGNAIVARIAYFPPSITSSVLVK